MKLIFLDIDGVLNSSSWNEAHPEEIHEGRLIDKEKVKLLSKLVQETQAKIVLHSGWRFWFNENMTPLRREALYFVKLLEEQSLSLYDKTPDLTTEEIRASKKFSLVKASEILEWLKQHEEIDNYIVLEDLELHNKEIELHQIKTDASEGLTDENVAHAIRFLKQMEGAKTMEKGVCVYNGIDCDRRESFKAIKEAGFDTVMLDWSTDFSESDNRVEDALFAREAGLRIENAHLSFKNINSMWLEGTEGDERMITLADDICLAAKNHIKILILHTSGGVNQPLLSEIGFKRFEKLIQVAEENQIVLAFENVRNNVYLDKIFDLYPSPFVGFCYDSGHRNCFTKGENLLEKYKDKVVAIHLHDNDGTGDQHQYPLEGTIDWKKEMIDLSNTNYNGSLTLEVLGDEDLDYQQNMKKSKEVADQLQEFMM